MELPDLTNNNLVNVLVALGTMASAYTPQEDLLKVRYKSIMVGQKIVASMIRVCGSNLRVGHEARRD